MTGVEEEEEEGVFVATLANFFLALSFLIDFFRGCWKYGPIIREIIENVQFAVQIGIF